MTCACGSRVTTNTHIAVGGGEGASDSGEREALHGTEADPTATAWTRGGRATSNLPTDLEREDQKHEGDPPTPSISVH